MRRGAKQLRSEWEDLYILARSAAAPSENSGNMRLRDQLKFCFLLLIVGKWTLADKITPKTLKYLRKALKEKNITFVDSDSDAAVVAWLLASMIKVTYKWKLSNVEIYLSDSITVKMLAIVMHCILCCKNSEQWTVLPVLTCFVCPLRLQKHRSFMAMRLTAWIASLLGSTFVSNVVCRPINTRFSLWNKNKCRQ